MSQAPEGWWEFRLSHQAGEEVGYLLIECGAAGIVVEDRSTFRAFVPAGKAADEFSAAASALGFVLQSRVRLEDHNWTRHCEALWEPLTIGALKITPVLDEDMAPPAPAPDQVYILPGTGFGTGHHPTTRMLIEFLQDRALMAGLPDGPVLDVGTGSAILALVAGKLLRRRVVGVDVDPEALQNASVNIGLNRASSIVDLQEGDLSVVSGCYSLITANIYAEVLCELAPRFEPYLLRGGMLLLSGILAAQAATVEAAYQGHGYTLCRRESDNDWVALAWCAPRKD